MEKIKPLLKEHIGQIAIAIAIVFLGIVLLNQQPSAPSVISPVNEDQDSKSQNEIPSGSKPLDTKKDYSYQAGLLNSQLSTVNKLISSNNKAKSSENQALYNECMKDISDRYEGANGALAEAAASGGTESYYYQEMLKLYKEGKNNCINSKKQLDTITSSNLTNLNKNKSDILYLINKIPSGELNESDIALMNKLIGYNQLCQFQNSC